MRVLPLVPMALLAICAPVAAQRHSVPSDTLLEGVTRRGVLLAGYDRAAWHASDALMALTPAPTPDEVRGYVAERTDDGWVVHFGRVSDDGRSFLVAYEARPTAVPDEYGVVALRPARPRTGFVLAAARAMEVAARDLGSQPRPYNAAALPAPGGEVWVYLLPAQVEEGVYPHGGDVRYRFAPDGERILEKRRLHSTVLDTPAPPAGALSGTHTAVLDDVPEDTDVFLVLTRRPSLPEVVVTEHYFYSIAPDGTIALRHR